jgi:hypothetical protein
MGGARRAGAAVAVGGAAHVGVALVENFDAEGMHGGLLGSWVSSGSPGWRRTGVPCMLKECRTALLIRTG